MLVIFACAVGVLFAAGVYLVLRRDLVVVAFGVGLIGTAANLLILVAARARHMQPALIGAHGGTDGVGNPLPQAFVLIAIPGAGLAAVPSTTLARPMPR